MFRNKEQACLQKLKKKYSVLWKHSTILQFYYLNLNCLKSVIFIKNREICNIITPLISPNFDSKWLTYNMFNKVIIIKWNDSTINSKGLLTCSVTSSLLLTQKVRVKPGVSMTKSYKCWFVAIGVEIVFYELIWCL